MQFLLAACLALAGLLGAARADVPIPPLSARVTDLTGTLSAQQKGELESRLAAFEAKRGSQIAVLLLPTTKPEEIEQFSIRLAEAWKVGRKGVDDGVILVVAKDDRRLRIEVGYGLEGVIPDAIARRVIDERITPRLREGDFFGGIRDGVDQLARLAEGEKLPEPAARRGGRDRDPVAGLFDYAVPALFFIVIAGGVLKLVLGRFAGSLATGLLLGLAAWFVFNLVAAAIAAAMGFLFTFANTGAGRGGWSSGGGSSRGGSGGWSGGGGSFGGGGASGRW